MEQKSVGWRILIKENSANLRNTETANCRKRKHRMNDYKEYDGEGRYAKICLNW